MISYNPKDWFTYIFRFHKADTVTKLAPLDPRNLHLFSDNRFFRTGILEPLRQEFYKKHSCNAHAAGFRYFHVAGVWHQHCI